MTLSPGYEELRSLVKTHEQQTAAQKAADKEYTAALQQSRRETAEAQAEASALREECKRLQALVATQREKRQKEKRAASQASQEQAEVQEQLAEAVRCETARSAAEVATLKRAAAADVRKARAAISAECDAQTSALREMMQLRSAKHALRLREVIASEERCEEARLQACARLREASLGVLAFAVRAVRAERFAKARVVEVYTLGTEVEVLEDELAACEEDATAAAAAHDEAAAEASAEIDALREQIRTIASKQKGWRKALAARHEEDVNDRVREVVEREVSRVQDDALADMEAHEAEHEAEVEALVRQRDTVSAERDAMRAERDAVIAERDMLELELVASRAREEQHRVECAALEKLMEGA